MSKPVKTTSSTTTAKKRIRRDSLGVTQKSNFVGRRATFVEADFLANEASVVPGSLNTVTRTRLASQHADLVTGGPTVFFKAHSGGALSQNAVASTRLARLLDMPNVIAHNAFGNTSIEKGVFSGTVPGVQLRTLAHDTPFTYPDAKGTQQEIDDYVKYSGGQVVDKGGQLFQLSGFVYQDVDFTDPAIQKGMADLQLFDAIAGQKDRHGGNIFIDPQNGTVTGIDDDQAFGAGPKPADVDKPWDKYMGLPPLVDRRTAERILRVNPNRVHTELAPRQGDLTKLTPKDIADAQERLEAVQAYLRKLQAGGQLIDNWGPATYRDAMAQPGKSYLGREATMLANAHQGGTFGGLALQLAPPAPQPAPQTAPQSTSTVPTSTLPTSTLPMSTLPTSTLPTSTLPTSTLPTSTLPTSTQPSSTLPTIAATRPPITTTLFPTQQRPNVRTGPSVTSPRPQVTLGASRITPATTTTTTTTTIVDTDDAPARAARIRMAATRKPVAPKVSSAQNVPTDLQQRVGVVNAWLEDLAAQVEQTEVGERTELDQRMLVLADLLRDLTGESGTGSSSAETGQPENVEPEEKGSSQRRDEDDDTDEPDDSSESG